MEPSIDRTDDSHLRTTGQNFEDIVTPKQPFRRFEEAVASLLSGTGLAWLVATLTF